MERSWFVSAAFGAALLIVGFLMMRSHYRTWQRQQADEELDEQGLAFFGRRYRRRMQASGLMAFIGVLIPVGDSVERFVKAPGWFAIYWIVVLLLVLWLFVLAFSDWASTKAHTTIALNRIRAQQRALEQQAASLRKQLHTGQNGSKKPGSEETDAT